MAKLGLSFYKQTDVVSIARQLLGKEIYTNINNILTSAIIVETEAYEGVTDKASHAYGNRRTKRTEIMYSEGGFCYVYLCYGMHSLFNVITNEAEIPHAILIRAVKPKYNTDEMLIRANKTKITKDFGIGPGKVSKILGINCSHNGLSLLDNTIWIEDININISDKDIISTKRIGINYAGEDANLLYRFLIDKNAESYSLE